MDLLQTIIDHKQREVAERKRAHSWEGWDLGSLPMPRSFKAALQAPGLSLIGEFKRKSPSAGVLREDPDPVPVAHLYHRAGVAAISVLTDTAFFGGSAEDCRRVREAVPLPILRKDFIVDPWQIPETRAMGADALLLLAGVLGDRLSAFLRATHEADLDALVEIHDEWELERALDAGADLVGINNRDLKTFRVDIETSLRLRRYIPPGVVTVSESGVQTPDDFRRIQEAGFDAVLIGTALMRASDPTELLDAFLRGTPG